jgi:hypothetical protein
MFKKVAIGQVFRPCFFDKLGGMPHTTDESETFISVTHENELTAAELATQAAPGTTPREPRTDRTKTGLLNETGTILKHIPFNGEDRTFIP